MWRNNNTYFSSSTSAFWRWRGWVSFSIYSEWLESLDVVRTGQMVDLFCSHFLKTEQVSDRRIVASLGRCPIFLRWQNFRQKFTKVWKGLNASFEIKCWKNIRKNCCNLNYIPNMLYHTVIILVTDVDTVVIVDASPLCMQPTELANRRRRSCWNSHHKYSIWWRWWQFDYEIFREIDKMVPNHFFAHSYEIFFLLKDSERSVDQGDQMILWKSTQHAAHCLFVMTIA
jgi:hypothetical protein